MNDFCGRPGTHSVLRRPQISLVGLLALLLAAGGCSDDDDPSTVERAEVTTTDATTTTTETPTTTTLAPCEPLGAPDPSIGEVTEAASDVDGDGGDDQIRSHPTGAEAWHLEVELARGGGAVLDIVGFGGPVGVIGGADVDGDGADEVWARTGAGASATIVGLFRLDGCDLQQVTVPTGELANLPVGGSVGTSSGVECTDDGEVLTHTASYVGDGSEDRYEVTTVAYELDGTRLVEGDQTTTEVAGDDPELLRFTSFTCGDLTL